MTLPNFLILGAAKTGTTSLYRYLRQHPKIYMSPAKEPRFFAFEGEILNYKGPGDAQETAKTDLKSYQDLFRDVTDETAIGEASTVYLWSPKAAERIQYYIPDAKLIAILRNPVERAYSNFLHLVQAEREPLSDFAQALKQEQERINNNWWHFWYYKEQGFYSVQLKRYCDRFDANQIKVYLYEDFQAEPITVVKDIFRFLEVDSDFTPNLSEKVRQSRRVPKNKALHSLLTQPNPLKAILKPLLPTKVRQRVADNLNQKNLVKPKVSPEVCQQLIEEYREDIVALQDLIKRDLSNWLHS